MAVVMCKMNKLSGQPCEPMVVVTSPIISLITDQIESHSKLDHKASILERLRRNNFSGKSTKGWYRQRLIGIVSDEAHSIVNW